MRTHFLAVVLVCAALPALAESTSALKALKLLPKEDLANVARIEGPDGSPEPERWYILVHSPSSDNGLKEFVIANGELVAARQISQFAENLAPSDVVGSKAIRVDSDRMSKLVGDFAKANDVTYTSLNYRLSKEGSGAEPLWRVICKDADGQEVGAIVTTTDTAKVISHEGFLIEPVNKKTKQRKVKFRTQAKPEVAADQPIPEPKPMQPVVDPAYADEQTPPAIAENTSRSQNNSDRRASEERTRSHGVHPPNPVNAVRDVTRPFRRTIGRLLPF